MDRRFYKYELATSFLLQLNDIRLNDRVNLMEILFLDLQKIDQEGERLSKPAACPDDVYQLMLQCWAHEADVRPSKKIY